MTQEKLYYCNLCDQEILTPERLDQFDGEPLGFGLEADGHGAWKPREDFYTAPIHICSVCVSSIRLLGPMCGQGVADCQLGPNCERHGGGKAEPDAIDKAFKLWWKRLGRKMPRPDPKETDAKYRKRSAHCAFLAAAASLILQDAGGK